MSCKRLLLAIVLMALVVSSIAFAGATVIVLSNTNPAATMYSAGVDTCRPPTPAFAAKSLANRIADQGFPVISGAAAMALVEKAGITLNTKNLAAPLISSEDAVKLMQTDGDYVVSQNVDVHGVYKWPSTYASGKIVYAAYNKSGKMLSAPEEDTSTGPNKEEATWRWAEAGLGVSVATDIIGTPSWFAGTTAGWHWVGGGVMLLSTITPKTRADRESKLIETGSKSFAKNFTTAVAKS